MSNIIGPQSRVRCISRTPWRIAGYPGETRTDPVYGSEWIVDQVYDWEDEPRLSLVGIDVDVLGVNPVYPVRCFVPIDDEPDISMFIGILDRMKTPELVDG